MWHDKLDINDLGMKTENLVSYPFARPVPLNDDFPITYVSDDLFRPPSLKFLTNTAVNRPHKVNSCQLGKFGAMSG